MTKHTAQGSTGWHKCIRGLGFLAAELKGVIINEITIFKNQWSKSVFSLVSFGCRNGHFGGGFKITEDGDYSHEIKRRLLGKKVMTLEEKLWPT